MNDLDFDSSGAYLACGAGVINVESMTFLTTVLANQVGLTGVRFVSNANGIITSSLDNSIKIYTHKPSKYGTQYL